MTQMTAAQILGEGATIELRGGKTVALVYDFGALAEIEKRHGSVNGLVEILNQGENGPIFDVIGHALWAGTDRTIALSEFNRLLVPAKIAAYVDAFGTALSEAMGDTPGEAKAAPAA